MCRASSWKNRPASGNVAWVTWADFPDTAIYAARVDGTTVDLEVVDPDHSSYGQPVSVAIDAAGEPHVAYRYDAPGDRRIIHAARSAGTWSLERSIVLRLESQGALGIAISSEDEIVMGAADDEGLYIGTRHEDRWFTQRILPGCDNGDHFDIEFDASDTLQVAHACHGDVQLYSRTETLFPADYGATCEQAATTLCATSCQCGAGACCFDGGDHCVDPESFCRVVVQSEICGDAAQDPALLYQCNDAAPGKVCDGVSLEDVPECPEI